MLLFWGVEKPFTAELAESAEKGFEKIKKGQKGVWGFEVKRERQTG
jgi:hypothetical protein